MSLYDQFEQGQIFVSTVCADVVFRHVWAVINHYSSSEKELHSVRRRFCSSTWRIQVLNGFQHTESLYTAKQAKRLHNSNIRQSQDNEIPEMKSLLALRCCFFFAGILWHCVCGSAVVQTWMKADCTLLALERKSAWLELYWMICGRIIRWEKSCQNTYTWAFNCGHQTHKTEV